MITFCCILVVGCACIIVVAYVLFHAVYSYLYYKWLKFDLQLAAHWYDRYGSEGDWHTERIQC